MKMTDWTLVWAPSGRVMAAPDHSLARRFGRVLNATRELVDDVAERINALQPAPAPLTDGPRQSWTIYRQTGPDGRLAFHSAPSDRHETRDVDVLIRLDDVSMETARAITGAIDDLPWPENAFYRDASVLADHPVLAAMAAAFWLALTGYMLATCAVYALLAVACVVGECSVTATMGPAGVAVRVAMDVLLTAGMVWQGAELWDYMRFARRIRESAVARVHRGTTGGRRSPRWP